jgi:hypothetical protein
MTELRHRMEVIRSRRQRGKLSGSISIVVSKLCLRGVYYSLAHKQVAIPFGSSLGCGTKIVPSELLFSSLPSARSWSAASGSRSSSVAVPGTRSRWRSWMIPRGIVTARLRERPSGQVESCRRVALSYRRRYGRYDIHYKCSQRSTAEADMDGYKHQTFQGRGASQPEL